jgi:geranylgeranyl pyrophosphate synthase
MISAAHDAKAALAADQALITQALEQVLERYAPGGSVVHAAMRYAVLGHGQRIRPVLALRVARAVGGDPEFALRAGLAVELLHAASLVIDDLPCMDNADTRRELSTVHRAFGEATAVLAAIALVALAARLPLSEDSTTQAGRRLNEFARRLLATLDCSALIAGQALDLGLDPETPRPDLEALAALKTAPLFELAALAGLVGATADRAAETDLMAFGAEFGVAFQLADDCRDGELGDPAPARLHLESARRRVAPYGEAARGLLELVDWLESRIGQA